VHPPREERELGGKNQTRAGWQRDEITALTYEGKTAEEIAHYYFLSERGVEFKAGAATVWRLQTYWKLVDYDPQRAKGVPKYRRSNGGCNPPNMPPKQPRQKLTEEELVERRRKRDRRKGREKARRKREVREAAMAAARATGHYPRNCSFGPVLKPRVLGDQHANHGVFEHDMEGTRSLHWTQENLTPEERIERRKVNDRLRMRKRVQIMREARVAEQKRRVLGVELEEGVGGVAADEAIDHEEADGDPLEDGDNLEQGDGEAIHDPIQIDSDADPDFDSENCVTASGPLYATDRH